MPLWVEIVATIGALGVTAFALAVLGRGAAMRRTYDLQREHDESIRRFRRSRQ